MAITAGETFDFDDEEEEDFAVPPLPDYPEEFAQDDDSPETTVLSSEHDSPLPDLNLTLPECVATPTSVQPRRLTVRDELTTISSPRLLTNSNVEEVVAAATSKPTQSTRKTTNNAPNTPYRSKLRSSKKNTSN